MPVITYETLFLLDSTKVTADAEGVKGQIHHILERHGGHVIISRPWDYNHKLAYPIRKQKKGAFHVIYYTMDSLKQKELERDFALAAEGVILRSMTLRIDPKWQEAVLQVAREDAGNGFALRGMHEEAAATTDPSALGGDAGLGIEGELAGVGGGPGGGPRRGRRGDHPEKPE
jgi:small subunit ribosomal protein S6